jgi:hypothetical protein
MEGTFARQVREYEHSVNYISTVSCMQAVAAARLEEHAQIEKCGFVKGGHDLDEADITTRIGGALLFLRMLEADCAAVDESTERTRKDVDSAVANLSKPGLDVQ